MDKNIQYELDNLIKMSDEISRGRHVSFDEKKEVLTSWVASESIGQCQLWFSKIMFFLGEFTPKDSFYYREAERIISGSKRVGGTFWDAVVMMKAHLQAIECVIDKDGIGADYNKKGKEIEIEAEVLELKPTAWGCSVDLKLMWRRFYNWMRKKKR